MAPLMISDVQRTDHGPCANLYVYKPTQIYETVPRLSTCDILLHCFAPLVFTALPRTALPLPSIALSLLLLILLAAHACTLIASILQEYRLQTLCPCYKCDHCLE